MLRTVFINRSRFLLKTVARSLSYETFGKDSTENSRIVNWLTLIAAGTAGVTGALHGTSQVSHSEVKPLRESPTEQNRWKDVYIFSLAHRQRVFFKYEKRIRNLSTPEKIFDYFSSVEKDNVRYMTSADLLRALVPVYPPEGSPIERGGALAGERVPCEETVKLLQLFDLDGDNLISFHEYLIVLIFLSIPLRDIEVIFDVVDLDDNGVIDRKEFQIFMEGVKEQSRQAKKSLGGKRSGLRTVELEETGLLVEFFGKDGSKKLKLKGFRDFLIKMNEKLIKLEYLHYDYHDTHLISAKDFARSMIAGSHVRSINHYLKRIDSMDKKLAGYKFSESDFTGFYSVLQYIHKLEVGLLFYERIHGTLPMKEFGLIFKHITERELDQKVLEMVFYVFGDKEGNLDSRGLLKSLRGRMQGFVSDPDHDL
eukprot:g688.t1